MFLIKFLPIMIGTNWSKQMLYLALEKHCQNIDNRYNALVANGKSLVEINM